MYMYHSFLSSSDREGAMIGWITVVIIFAMDVGIYYLPVSGYG